VVFGLRNHMTEPSCGTVLLQNTEFYQLIFQTGYMLPGFNLLPVCISVACFDFSLYLKNEVA